MRFLWICFILALAGCAVPLEEGAPGEDALPGIGGKADGNASEFFADDTFYYVRIRDWPRDRMSPSDLRDETSSADAELLVYRADPASTIHCPDPDAANPNGRVTEDDLVHRARVRLNEEGELEGGFSMRISGNLTLGTPKSSFKLSFEKADRMFGMRALNLKSMWNDVSQMREAMAWDLFEDAGVHAPRHTYARFCVNDRYYGLYSVIENVDAGFLKERFGRNDGGNLYKAYWADIGPATLARRVSAQGDDSGAQYFADRVLESRDMPLAIPDAPRDTACGARDGNPPVERRIATSGAASDARIDVTIEHERASDLEVVVRHSRRNAPERDRVKTYVLHACADAETGTLSLAERVETPWGADGEWTLRVVDRRTGTVGRVTRFSVRLEDRSYALKTNENPDDDAEHQTYDDLAQLVRVINGVNIPGGDQRFDTDAYRDSVRAIFDVDTFLRWASANILLGAWDNYWATPANYYLYNSGTAAARKEFMERPYFHFIPWDYDNSLGVDYFDVEWQYADLVDWEASTEGYYDDGRRSDLPLVRNLLKNREFLRYYLDHVDHLITTSFNEQHVEARIGTAEREGPLWNLVRPSAYLESDFERGPQHTGRQFTNEQVYWNGFRHDRLGMTYGILHYVRMRSGRARVQLDALRAMHPLGSSGATFPAIPGPLP